MNYKIAIVEDNKDSVNLIIEYLNKYSSEYGIEFDYFTFYDGIELTNDYNGEYDIIILDIEMEVQDGIKTAEIIRQYDKEVIIIFVTNMGQYAIKGYQFDALSFLLKPVSYFAFKSEIDKSLERIQQLKKEKYLLVPSAFGLKKINSNIVLYLESIKHDIIIYTENETYSFRGTIKSYEKELLPYSFVRCHNSYLVNLIHVTGVEGDFVIIKKNKIKISRSRKKAFMEALVDYIGYRR
jgi:DNA-binding LytR/AlgR family response regulator